MADKRGLRGFTGEQITNPVRAIRKNCLDCMCGSSREVELCTVTYCPLYPFRFGSNPYRSERVLTEEQKTKQAEILRSARMANKDKKKQGSE